MSRDRIPEADRLALMRTLEVARTRRHGRTERFEDSLAPAELSGGAERRPRLRLGEVIGEGGMGTVHGAVQPGLDRDVAVKTLRAGASSTHRFLQEARVGGLVEHPNVIPVYDLLVTEDGTPALVMKRVAGEAWTSLLADPERLPEPDRADPLTFHLRVLMAICDALQYAHDIGIVHRDVKPDNVMIGAFGEVYLLDWGLAVSTRDEHEGFIALTRDCQGVAGTPSYMSPEMAAADSAALGPRTDVYLLGATLHEIVTGRPPHTGDTLYMVALAAFESQPGDYPPDVAPELAAICRRAMSREPSDRFASAAELRGAVEAFLTHRESHELARSGRRALTRLERRIDERQLSPAGGAGGPIEDLFGVVRFSLGQAIQLWPGNDEARADWQRALVRMGRYELSRGRPAAAAALLAEQAEPDAELSEALRSARDSRERRDEEVSELRRLQREHDLAVNRVIRSRMALAFGVLWLIVTLVTGQLERAGVVGYDHRTYLAAGGLIAVFVASLGLVGRALVANVVNRRIYLAAAGGLAAAVFGRVAVFVQEAEVTVAFAREQVIYVLITCVIAIISDLRILAGAVALAVTAAASAIWPPHAIELGGLGLFLAHLSMAYAWSRPR